jgi:hypothetical protein
LDTRKKIIPLERAKKMLDNGAWTVIVGLFDPLTALQARRIETSGGAQTLIVVLESSDALLPADARCQLMAALRSVNLVVQATRHDWQAIAPHREDCQVIDDENEEKRRSQEFFELVASRYNS